MGEVDELTALWTFVGIFGGLGGLMLYARRAHGRRLSSGRQLCSLRLLRDGTKLVATPRLSITLPGKICRLVLSVRMTGEYVQRRRPFGGEVAIVLGTPYTLTVSDRSGRVLYQEQNELGRFTSLLGSRSSGWSIGSRERNRWDRRGKIVLLDLVPREPGVYQVAVETDVRAEVEAAYSSSWAELVEAELSAAEGAVPISGMVRRSYPHRTVEV